LVETTALTIEIGWTWPCFTAALDSQPPMPRNENTGIESREEMAALSGISGPLEIVMRLPGSQRPMSQMPSTVLLSRKPIYEPASTAVRAENLVFHEG
jgi:hypothetical protein